MIGKYKNKREQGFTIIEVLIVLAIAGLILLIVFLAVPALQRNARNTSRKEDASSLSAALQEFEDNNGGSVPNIVCGAAPTWTVNVGATCGAASGVAAQFKTGYYTTAETIYVAGAAGTPATANSDTIYAVTGALCSGTSTYSATGASARDYAIMYGYETSPGSFTGECIGS